ncbi:la-related protein 7-like isoform X2 [Amphiura filiformis]|uniref:la-related protein 7-like isoform X2 n=1 Tax=Amphiura filiformis TaxID=82378 RepID=UPI003B21AFBF
MDTNESNIGDNDKKKRKRNKQLLKDIRQQVEFYFGDANLRKDRFLKQEISQSEDRYVDVSIIASFNRMNVLCPDPGLIPQALSTSDLLELSDDKTKIRRKIPLGEPEHDTDDITVYVECLPKTVDHDWLRKVFGVCGSVEYVSLPRYRSTGDPKGFAFIEFKTPEEANRACEMLNNPPEEDTGKLGRFPKTKGRRYVPVDEENKELDQEQDEDMNRTSSKKRSHDEYDDNKQGSESHKRHKRRHRESESSDGKPERYKRKRQHSDNNDANSHGKKTRQESGGQQNKKDESKVDEQKERETKEEKKHESREHHTKGAKGDHSTERDEKKKEKEEEKEKGEKKAQPQVSKDKEDVKSARKRKHSDSGSENEDTGSKKNRSCDVVEADVSDTKDDDETKKESDSEEKGKKKRPRKKKQEKKKESKENDLQLRVISKKEWMDLKHKYLSLQKASIAKIKQAYRFGGAVNTVKDENMETKAIKSSEPEFTPGVVLKIETKKPMESRQQLKDDLQAVAPVAYVDLQPGEQSGFVRCKSSEGASQILNKYGPNETTDNITVVVLTGEDEKQYWEKLKADRNNKLNSKQKKKKKRGVDRLLCKAEKVSLADAGKGSHIHFDDE